jgi:hypothetical protein
MHKSHVTLVALLVAGAAVLGAVAVTKTTRLGSAARHTNDASVASRTKQLSAFAAKLRQELKAKPPAIPKVPKRQPVPAVAAAPPAPMVVYHRPPPVIHVIHHHSDDSSGEADGGGGGDG